MSAVVDVEYVTWNEIHRALGVLASRVLLNGKPDVLVLIAKGGLIPGRILADFLLVEDIGLIEAKFYKSIGVRGEKPFIKSSTLPSLTGRSVLVVDDVADTGRTMQLVIDYLSNYKVKSIKTLTIYVKPWSTFIPDYYFAQTTKWIVFPWEICEAIREKVAEKTVFKELSDYCEV